MKTIWNWLFELDRILRGEKTRVTDLRNGELDIPLWGIAVVVIVLGMIYGVCMGCYALFNFGRAMQMLACVVKVPALFFLTLAVTMPSLYVFNAIVGSKLTVHSLARLFVGSLGVNLALLSSLGPIVAFFSINTASYSFMVLLNVVVFAASGTLSMAFLLQTLHRLNIAPQVSRLPTTSSTTIPPTLPKSLPMTVELPADSSIAKTSNEEMSAEAMAGGLPPEVENDYIENEVDFRQEEVATSTLAPLALEQPGPLTPVEGHVLGRHVKTVFACWIFVFALVGAQMSWVLRPFIGAPGMEFEWFRPRGSNFFEAVVKALESLFHR